MTRDEFMGRWSQRADELKRLAANVDGQKVIAELLAELALLFREEDSQALTLREAAQVSGYSPDHLGREVRAGRIPNVGRRNAPRIRRGDLPRKPGRLLSSQPENMFARRQIARSVVTSRTERNHDG
jgi:hypothetical protein